MHATSRKTWYLTAAVLLLLGGYSMVCTAAQPTTTPTHHVLPVLLGVNSHGTITNMQPAYRLQPVLRRRLHKALAAMIVKPAHDGHGDPISSQLVMYVDVLTTPNQSGGYVARFAYVKSVPVPSGNWYWDHLVRAPGNERLALVAQGSGVRHRIGVRHLWRSERHYRRIRPHQSSNTRVHAAAAARPIAPRPPAATQSRRTPSIKSGR